MLHFHKVSVMAAKWATYPEKLEISIPRIDLPVGTIRTSMYTEEKRRSAILRRRETCRDGASGIHSIFGEWRNNEFRHPQPRMVLRESFGMSFIEFQTKVGDETLCSRFKKYLWNKIVKPRVCADEDLESTVDVGIEEALLWERIKQQLPSVALKCKEVVKTESDARCSLKEETEEPFENFMATIFPVYIGVAGDPDSDYFIGEVELLALCCIHRKNIILTTYDFKALEEGQYARDRIVYKEEHTAVPDSEYTWICVWCNSSANFLRTYVQRLEVLENKYPRDDDMKWKVCFQSDRGASELEHVDERKFEERLRESKPKDMWDVAVYVLSKVARDEKVYEADDHLMMTRRTKEYLHAVDAAVSASGLSCPFDTCEGCKPQRAMQVSRNVFQLPANKINAEWNKLAWLGVGCGEFTNTAVLEIMHTHNFKCDVCEDYLPAEAFEVETIIWRFCCMGRREGSTGASIPSTPREFREIFEKSHVLYECLCRHCKSKGRDFYSDAASHAENLQSICDTYDVGIVPETVAELAMAMVLGIRLKRTRHDFTWPCLVCKKSLSWSTFFYHSENKSAWFQKYIDASVVPVHNWKKAWQEANDGYESF